MTEDDHREVLALRPPAPMSFDPATPQGAVRAALAKAKLIPSMSAPEQRIYVVAPDGSGDYPDVPTAVQDAPSGSTVLLRAGMHRLRAPVVVARTLSLRGDPMDTTVLVCNAEGAVLRGTDTARLAASNLTFAHDGMAWANVVEVNGGEITIEHCRLTGGVSGAEPPHPGGSGLVLRRGVVAVVRSRTESHRICTCRGAEQHATFKHAFGKCCCRVDRKTAPLSATLRILRRGSKGLVHVPGDYSVVAGAATPAASGASRATQPPTDFQEAVLVRNENRPARLR